MLCMISHDSGSGLIGAHAKLPVCITRYFGSLDLLQTIQLTLHCTTATVTLIRTPGHNGSIAEDGPQKPCSRLGSAGRCSADFARHRCHNHRYHGPRSRQNRFQEKLQTQPFVAWIWDTVCSRSGKALAEPVSSTLQVTVEPSEQSHRGSYHTQVTTDPSRRIAAKVPCVAWIFLTFFSRCCTSLPLHREKAVPRVMMHGWHHQNHRMPRNHRTIAKTSCKGRSSLHSLPCVSFLDVQGQ